MTTAYRDFPILVVEDSDEDFDTVLDALHNLGLACEIHRAITGDACLNLLRGAALNPCMVLLDLNIPGTDGRVALREIKSDPVLRAIPVVVFSTSANPRDLAECYESGANAYHVKPLQYPDHIDILGRIFNYWLECATARQTGNGPP